MTLRSSIAGAAAIVLAVAIPTHARSQQTLAPLTPRVTGTWTGSVTQVGSTDRYAMVLTVRNNGGETDYPSLNCGGKLTRVGSSAGYTFYIERITRGRLDQGGRCIDGSITIAPAGDRLAWGWVGADQGEAVVAFSTLVRTPTRK
jgi:hypothetical protein